MRRILNSKAGVTVLEGVIALGLLALVAAGSFGVLLSASRQDSLPDIREEMSYAVEQANDKLKVYLQASQGEMGYAYLPTSLQQGLCGNDTAPLASNNPNVSTDRHYISCLLPLVCDKSNNKSHFYYTVEPPINAQTGHLSSNSQEGDGTKQYGTNYSMNSVGQGYRITFKIRCNGYEL